MTDLLIFLIIFFLSQAVLAVPVAHQTNSLKRFLIATIVAFFAVTLPLLFFLLSAIMLPECKHDCKFGWLDCFIKGKSALIPLALWATAALYAVDVLRVVNRTRSWIVLGMLSGALIADVCLAFGIAFFAFRDWGNALFLLIPFYVAVWYSIRAVQLLRASHPSSLAFMSLLFGSVPFWLASIVWSMSTYRLLPETASDGCFVVTAASRGHRHITGPHTEIIRHGRRRCANQQLLTFWELETRWQRHLPQSHAAFRRIYNLVGPIIAARIKSPWVADVVFLGLKPLEIVASCLLCVDPVARHVSAPGDGRTPKKSPWLADVVFPGLKPLEIVARCLLCGDPSCKTRFCAWSMIDSRRAHSEEIAMAGGCYLSGPQAAGIHRTLD